MIDTRSKTILLMRDDYPGCEAAECDFIRETLEGHGYIVREITVSEFLSMPCMIGFKSFLLVIPGARSLPVSTMEKLREFIESAGSALFIGGPLYYDLVVREDGKFVKKPLENELDAAMPIDGHYIREGICPSYKTYDAKRVTTLKPSPGQDIFGGGLKIPAEFPDGINVTIPCETGSHFWRSSNRCRFIPLAECFSNQETDPVKRGLRGGRRGAFAFIELERTNGIGYQGKFDYGIVENTAVGSAVAMIGARCGLEKLDGADELLCNIADKLLDGLYLMNGGADGIRYREGESVNLGAEIMNTSRSFREVTLRITAGGKAFERGLLLSPRSMKTVDLTEVEPFDGEVVCELIESGRIADRIASSVSIEVPAEVTDPAEFVKASGDHFELDGRRWYMAGINYWSTYSPAREKSDYWRGMFELSNYNPETVEGDLAYAAELGLNCLLTRVDFTDLDLALHGLRDFLWRCERHGLRVWLAFRGYCSRYYDKRAVERLFELVHIKNNPTVMALDLEWESAGDMRNSLIRDDFSDEWESWLIKTYGSLGKAEEKLGKLAKNRFGYAGFPTGRTLETAKAMRHFTADSIDAAWEKLTPHLRSLIPNQLLTFRTGSACPDTRSQAGRFIDFSALETYDLPCFGDLSDPENAKKSAARIVCLTKAEQFENGGKPVVWAEYGRSVCGTKWAKKLLYDHDSQCYLESELEAQKLYNGTMESAMSGANIAGSAPWWWCGGFRFTEMADFGYLTPDGLMNESGRSYIEFCERMKAHTDTRPVEVVRGNVDEYPSKDAFIREICVPAAIKASEDGRQIAVETEYEEI